MIPAYTKTIKQGGTTLTPIKPTLQREERYSQHTEYQSIAPLRFVCKWLCFNGLHPLHAKGMSLQADGI